MNAGLKEKKDNYLYHLLFVIILVAFVLFKWEHLKFPFCWDESIFYGPAVHKMYERGPSLSPEALPILYSRGHPLLFHFLGASWMTVFGTSVVASHLFGLSISICLLVMVYFFCVKLFSSQMAIITIVIILAQPIFLVQSTLVLPEVLLALFMITALFSYLASYRWLYWVSAACAIMTKESAIVLFGAIPLYNSIVFISEKEKKYFSLIKEWTFVVSPVLVWGLFLVWQRLTLGWFFFPEHTGYIDFTPSMVWDKFSRILLVVFVWNSRNVMAVLCIILLLVAIKNKESELLKKFKPYFQLFMIFIFLFAVFSSLNFFTNRYIISLILLFAIITGYSIQSVLHHRMIIAWALVSLIVGCALLNSVGRIEDCDHNWGYVNTSRARMNKNID